MLPKFIITRDGVLRLGMVNQHKDLLEPEDDCIWSPRTIASAAGIISLTLPATA